METLQKSGNSGRASSIHRHLDRLVCHGEVASMGKYMITRDFTVPSLTPAHQQPRPPCSRGYPSMLAPWCVCLDLLAGYKIATKPQTMPN